MSNKKNMIKVSEIDRLIAEEITRLKKVEQIKARLAVVNEELKRLGEEEGIEEVSVGGTRNGDEWYEKGVPVPKFEKKGTHLKEEDPTFGDEAPAGDDVMGDDTLEVGDDVMGAEGEGEVLETFEEKLAAIGRELDAKFGGGTGMGAEMGDDEVAVDLDGASEEPAAEPEAPEADAAPEAEDEIEIDETEAPAIAETEEPAVTPEECMEEEKAPINESRDNLGKKTNPILAKELKRAAYLAGLSDED